MTELIIKLVIEVIVSLILFTVVVILLTIKDPLASINDYPKAIRERCIELGLIEPRNSRYTKKELIRKILAMLVFCIIASIILFFINEATSFIEGFIESYIIWFIICWYDAFIIDCVWFTHSKKVRIKGTTDMKEYKDYLFHIKQSLIGTILGIPCCAFIGLICYLLSLI